jgi:hypothetical protein
MRRNPPRSPAEKAISLEDFWPRAHTLEYLTFLVVALARAGLDENHLAPYQDSLLRDLRDPLDEEALAKMLAYWDLIWSG